MTIVAVVGDCTTTISVALAAGWPVTGEVIIVEADRRGGSLAGWLDTPTTPSLTTIVSRLGSSPTGAMATITAMAHRSASGVRFVAAPLRASATRRAINEATTAMVPALARADLVAIADVGIGHEDSPFVDSAGTVVVVHRQASASPGAAAVRLERLTESIEQLAGSRVVLAIVGDRPFEPGEIAAHVEAAAPDSLLAVVPLAHDPLAAAVIAGRPGLSARRVQRLPLMRSAADLAERLSRMVPSATVERTGS